MSDSGSEEMTRIVNEAIESGDLESLKGYEFVTQDNTRMVPDILQNGADFFFPVFTSIEDMYLHEWKKSYVDQDVLDGTQWSLEIKLTGGRKRTYTGSNDYPPYWNELLKVFKPFADV